MISILVHIGQRVSPQYAAFCGQKWKKVIFCSLFISHNRYSDKSLYLYSVNENGDNQARLLSAIELYNFILFPKPERSFRDHKMCVHLSVKCYGKRTNDCKNGDICVICGESIDSRCMLLGIENRPNRLKITRTFRLSFTYASKILEKL